jgi:hypothetical protein
MSYLKDENTKANQYLNNIFMINIYNNLSFQLKQDFMIKLTKILNLSFHEIISIMEKPVVEVTEQISILVHQLMLYVSQNNKLEQRYYQQIQSEIPLSIAAQEYIPIRQKSVSEENYLVIKQIWEKHEQNERNLAYQEKERNLFPKRDILDCSKFRKN